MEPTSPFIFDANLDAGLLCLLQDYSRPDVRWAENGLMAASAYTVLQSLLRGLGEELRIAVLGDTFSPDASWHSVADHIEQFARNPLAKLQALGCTLGTRRNIEVLYRVREFGREHGDGEAKTSTFGYPIYIAEARTDG